MTKGDYIKAHPKSMLADSLISTDWDDNAEIEVSGGLPVPDDKRSNLYHALQGTSGRYVLGGHRRRGTEGWYFAVLK